jgi:hypothetical protein
LANDSNENGRHDWDYDYTARWMHVGRVCSTSFPALSYCWRVIGSSPTRKNGSSRQIFVITDGR